MMDVCGNCDMSAVSKTCKDCGLVLCNECSDFHPKIKSFRGHCVDTLPPTDLGHVFQAPTKELAGMAIKAKAPDSETENLFKSDLSVAEKVRIAMSVGEEVLTTEELEKLYTAKDHPIVYDGFEPSGRMHIAQGVLR